MANKELSSTATKTQFVESIYKWLMRTLKENGNEEYQSCFVKEGASIMCHLPTNYFQNCTIPEGITIEMKFIAKKGQYVS